MTDITLDRYLVWGTAADRAAFTPSPGVGGTGTNILPIWQDSDVDGNPVWSWDTATSAWIPFAAGTTSSSSQLWQYKANTGATSGYPGDGFMLWDNATQTSATHLLFSHITSDGLDIDLFLAQLPTSGTIIIQDATNSSDQQTWTISGAAVNTNPGTSTSYWTVPVTLASSSGVGTTGFANDERLIAVVFAAASGAGTVTTTGTPAGGNLTKFSGATSITNGDLSGDVTTTGTLATTIANNAVTTTKINNSAVTLAKIANAAASSKLLGSGASGSGAAYTELTLGTNLSMSGTTLNASGGGTTYTVPDLASFTWVNQGSSSAAQNPATTGPILATLAPNGSLNWRLLTLTPPSPPYKLTALIRGGFANINSQTVGIYFYDGTKLMGFELLVQGGPAITARIEKITNVNTDNTTVATVANTAAQSVFYSYGYLQIRHDGTTLYFDYGDVTGQNFTNVFSESVGTFITPTKIGFGGVNVTASATLYTNLLNWTVATNANLNP